MLHTSKARTVPQPHILKKTKQKNPPKQQTHKPYPTKKKQNTKKMCSCGTLGYDLIGMVLLGGWLDWMILEVFSNL